MIYQPCFICCRPVMDQHGTLTLSSPSADLVFHKIQHWDKTAGLLRKNFGTIIVVEAVRECTSLELDSSLLTSRGILPWGLRQGSNILQLWLYCMVFFTKRPHREWWGCNPEQCYTSHHGRAAQPWWQGVRQLGMTPERDCFRSVWALPITS